ncbi:M13 family metallopeptidase [Fimbriimonas ginsengisoli]|uniref:Endothelin-converting enzyme 1 n=1 Tax=Fimbriimonas ginsengisoli Gsoil 348 TaxID=661478 RepID=A0A068NW68_FIMGI|nr:M13 family metallopeptidase [Fimbriimonas ginsengisoli]AIE85854.1 Endothelin-converting enzyme 1 [Fimbriimonas ginsengisoli Gsoil 348]
MIALAIAVALLRSAPDVLQSHIDTSVDPGVDFFQYANGGWFRKNPIPPAESGWGIGNLVRDELYARQLAVNKKAASGRFPEGSDDQKIGDFWVAAMDEAKAEQVGLKPLAPWLTKIDGVATTRDAISVGFALQELGVRPFFNVDVYQDEKRSDVMSLHLSQGGLEMPGRDYYLDSEPRFATIRGEYLKYIAGILELSGGSGSDAPGVLKFETALATVSRKIEELRDTDRNYHMMPLAEVQAKLDPSIPWVEALATWNLRPKEVVVGQPEFFSGLETLLAATPPADLRAYLRFHLVSQFAPYLNKRAEALSFDFNNRTLSGQKEPQPRWKRALEAENSAIGFILGKSFVKEYFPPASKKRYSDLIEAFRRTYAKRIDRLAWMSPATKAKAHHKLATMVKKVGYPDRWKDYSALKIGRSSFCENMIAASQWSFRDEISKFGKPVDRKEWDITPQTFNAYYNPSNNEIVMPAAAFAIPGLKDSEIDEPLLYGNAGASWIGHEMTHGFDDQGRQFDFRGNFADWWTKEDAAQFENRAALMVKQFDGYEPLPGLHINGQATLGENIADYGGLLLGLDAFKESKSYKEGKKIAGLTPMQRFFLGYDLSWLREQTEQSLTRGLKSDVHAPAKWRVNGPLSNLPDFYEAFGVKPGQPMWRDPSLRPDIW